MVKYSFSVTPEWVRKILLRVACYMQSVPVCTYAEQKYRNMISQISNWRFAEAMIV